MTQRKDRAGGDAWVGESRNSAPQYSFATAGFTRAGLEFRGFFFTWTERRGLRQSKHRLSQWCGVDADRLLHQVDVVPAAAARCGARAGVVRAARAVVPRIGTHAVARHLRPGSRLLAAAAGAPRRRVLMGHHVGVPARRAAGGRGARRARRADGARVRALLVAVVAHALLLGVRLELHEVVAAVLAVDEAARPAVVAAHHEAEAGVALRAALRVGVLLPHDGAIGGDFVVVVALLVARRRRHDADPAAAAAGAAAVARATVLDLAQELLLLADEALLLFVGELPPVDRQRQVAHAAAAHGALLRGAVLLGGLQLRGDVRGAVRLAHLALGLARRVLVRARAAAPLARRRRRRRHGGPRPRRRRRVVPGALQRRRARLRVVARLALRQGVRVVQRAVAARPHVGRETLLSTGRALRRRRRALRARRVAHAADARGAAVGGGAHAARPVVTLMRRRRDGLDHLLLLLLRRRLRCAGVPRAGLLAHLALGRLHVLVLEGARRARPPVGARGRAQRLRRGTRRLRRRARGSAAGGGDAAAALHGLLALQLLAQAADLLEARAVVVLVVRPAGRRLLRRLLRQLLLGRRRLLRLLAVRGGRRGGLGHVGVRGRVLRRVRPGRLGGLLRLLRRLPVAHEAAVRVGVLAPRHAALRLLVRRRLLRRLLLLLLHLLMRRRVRVGCRLLHLRRLLLWLLRLLWLLVLLLRRCLLLRGLLI
mmetsp:Transcript_35050/g.108189  ORF Transcript_35050/g.108189 Transcript_35050/m.108189 type:complete len:712 (-) Transcript_35050:460-2595(-)